ncbi:MAG: hypothetical protein ACXVB6_05660 [Mucilaginibacter sp.]
MKMQIKNSHKVITGIAFLVLLVFIIAFKAMENMEQVQNISSSQTKSKSVYIDVRIFMISDKVEALKKFITGWQEVQE